MHSFDFNPDRHALFLDVDGTVIDIAATPHGVTVPQSLAGTLSGVAARLDGALAVLSGRPIEEIDRLLLPLRVAAAGIHGAELRRKPDGPVERLSRLLTHEVTAPIAALAELPGVLVENKGIAIAVHFRNAPDGTEMLVRRSIERVLASPVGADLAMLAGKCVYEVKPLRLGKGSAVRTFMREPPFAGRLPVVIGDDVTDEAAFAVAPEFGGFGVAVGGPRLGASAFLPSPAAVRAWLEHVAEGS